MNMSKGFEDLSERLRRGADERANAIAHSAGQRAVEISVPQGNDTDQVAELYSRKADYLAFVRNMAKSVSDELREAGIKPDNEIAIVAVGLTTGILGATKWKQRKLGKREGWVVSKVPHTEMAVGVDRSSYVELSGPTFDGFLLTIGGELLEYQRQPLGPEQPIEHNRTPHKPLPLISDEQLLLHVAGDLTTEPVLMGLADLQRRAREAAVSE